MPPPDPCFRHDDAGADFDAPQPDWQAAALPLPPAIRLDSGERNPAGYTRREMLRVLLGDAADALTDADARRAFCAEYAKRQALGLNFDGVPDSIMPLYFESRFAEWDGAPIEAAEASSMRYDAADVMAMRFDFLDVQLSPAGAASKTPEGWIRDEPILSRTGVFEYQNADGSIRREFRPASEVFNRDSMASLRGIPVTMGHPGMVTADAHTGAIIGTVLTAGREDGSNLRAELVIHNPTAMGAHREISLGYRVVLDTTPGEWMGQRYDAVQRAIIYNHCAIVPKGRAGVSRLQMDAAGAVGGSLLPRIQSGQQAARERMMQVERHPGFHRQLARARADAAPLIQSAESARSLMIERTRNAWKGGRR